MLMERAERPDFNTISCYPQKVVGREQSGLTSTLYTAATNTVLYYHRKLMERSKAT